MSINFAEKPYSLITYQICLLTSFLMLRNNWSITDKFILFIYY
ncbi:hypothetical protein SASC598O11_008210 [Snodgrassella alvi SCGC AB-598-O11]|nr:hypothetical protein SASC598O11_008210 [Snodgrassella alvi SCGC AB-598-O11]